MSGTMTRVRNSNGPLALAVIAALVLPAAPAAARIYTLREQSDRAIDAAGVRELVVENPRGLVTLHRSGDRSIHLTALKLIRTTEQPRSVALARDTQVETLDDRGRYLVRVRYPQRQEIRINLWDVFRGDFELPRVEVRLALDVPDGLPVTVRTLSGDVESQDLSGPLSIGTSSGDVSVLGARGPSSIRTSSGSVTGRELAGAQVRTTSGDVSIDGVSGPLEARTTSGDLEVAGARDSLTLDTTSGDLSVGPAPRGIDLTTGSGDVRLEGVSGTARVETSSGDVGVRFAPGLHDAQVSTGSGGIRARLAPALACALDLRTTSGTLDVSVPVQVRVATRHQFSGVVRDGRLPIILRSSSGDIEVLSGGK
jgi:hypothetical protein